MKMAVEMRLATRFFNEHGSLHRRQEDDNAEPVPEQDL
jgi:hypothetical protein